MTTREERAMTWRDEKLAEFADNKLRVEQVDTDDPEAVKACLMRCVAGRGLWNAWRQREAGDDDTTGVYCEAV
ncbi:MAG: hypothetical protein JXC32_20610 [Anaerolineae bacterium]|nr:hypothetical protein [Anaerolineae bacterium]